MSTDNRDVMRRAFEEIIERGNAGYVDEALASDFVGHDTAGETFSRDDFRQGVEEMLSAFTGRTMHIEDQIASGDKVATRWTATGVHSGGFKGIPASGRPVRVTGISIDRVVAGKIIESWEVTDDLGVLQQIGVFPPAGAMPDMQPVP